MQEDIANAITKCECLVDGRKEQLVELNNELIEGFTCFLEKCQNKSKINEIISTLSWLMKATQKNFQFVKGPFPSIDSKILIL